MGYRIRVVSEVETWLVELRGTDPHAAGLVDDALDLLREAGAGLEAPLVVPVQRSPQPPQPDLDDAYRRQLELLSRARRGVAGAATARKRLELQIKQLEQAAATLAGQLAEALESGAADRAASARQQAAAVAGELKDLRRRYAIAQAQEKRADDASRRLQMKVDEFRTRREAAKAAEAALAAADLAVWAEATIEDADPGAPYPAGPTLTVGGGGPAPNLRELRPGAPEQAGIRILFAVRPPDTAVLLGAGTERDWLSAWYADVIQRCRDRYERDQGSTD